MKWLSLILAVSVALTTRRDISFQTVLYNVITGNPLGYTSFVSPGYADVTSFIFNIPFRQLTSTPLMALHPVLWLPFLIPSAILIYARGCLHLARNSIVNSLSSMTVFSTVHSHAFNLAIYIFAPSLAITSFSPSPRVLALQMASSLSLDGSQQSGVLFAIVSWMGMFYLCALTVEASVAYYSILVANDSEEVPETESPILHNDLASPLTKFSVAKQSRTGSDTAMSPSANAAPIPSWPSSLAFWVKLPLRVIASTLPFILSCLLQLDVIVQYQPLDAGVSIAAVASAMVQLALVHAPYVAVTVVAGLALRLLFAALGWATKPLSLHETSLSHDVVAAFKPLHGNMEDALPSEAGSHKLDAVLTASCVTTTSAAKYATPAPTRTRNSGASAGSSVSASAAPFAPARFPAAAAPSPAVDGRRNAALRVLHRCAQDMVHANQALPRHQAPPVDVSASASTTVNSVSSVTSATASSALATVAPSKPTITLSAIQAALSQVKPAPAESKAASAHARTNRTSTPVVSAGKRKLSTHVRATGISVPSRTRARPAALSIIREDEEDEEHDEVIESPTKRTRSSLSTSHPRRGALITPRTRLKAAAGISLSVVKKTRAGLRQVEPASERRARKLRRLEAGESESDDDGAVIVTVPATPARTRLTTPASRRRLSRRSSIVPSVLRSRRGSLLRRVDTANGHVVLKPSKRKTKRGVISASDALKRALKLRREHVEEDLSEWE